MTVDDFLEFAQGTAGWRVLERDEKLSLPTVPKDLARFRERCGGVVTPADIHVGSRVVQAQEERAEQHDDDRCARWFVIAEDDDSSTALRAVIDLDPQRLGRVHDGFWIDSA